MVEAKKMIVNVEGIICSSIRGNNGTWEAVKRLNSLINYGSVLYRYNDHTQLYHYSS